jgi:secreted trypsin-like serine protease
MLVIVMCHPGITRHDVDEAEYLRLAQEKQFDCVGQVFKNSKESGSCVLIGDRYVLTAAHVLIDFDMRPDTILLKGGTILGSGSLRDTIPMNGFARIISNTPFNQRATNVASLSVRFKEQSFKVKRITLYQSYLDTTNKGANDIALLELAEPVKAIAPARINTAFDELHANMVGVGYGESGPADRPELVGLNHKKIAGENVVDSLGGATYDGHESIMLCDFDHPTRTDCNKMGSPVPRPLEYTVSGGDSGGGLFRKKEGKWELIGICASSETNFGQLSKTGYYGEIMGWTRVSVFADWVRKTMNEKGLHKP